MYVEKTFDTMIFCAGNLFLLSDQKHSLMLEENKKSIPEIPKQGVSKRLYLFKSKSSANHCINFTAINALNYWQAKTQGLLYTLETNTVSRKIPMCTRPFVLRILSWTMQSGTVKYLHLYIRLGLIWVLKESVRLRTFWFCYTSPNIVIHLITYAIKAAADSRFDSGSPKWMIFLDIF